jgi:predicted AlkP superfamily phosphohydrolase/phosphomutase
MRSSPIRSATGRRALLLALVALLFPAGAAAYVGPGAGFAVLSSFLTLLLAFLYAFLALLTWPLRQLGRLLRGRRAYSKARVERVVIVGFDGMDPELAARWMRQGKLPHLARLAKNGTFRPLATTHPPISPVAWSTFLTGVNPGKHNIYDFLNRDRQTYLPFLSSAQVLGPRRRLRIGRRSIPLGRPQIKGMRKSKPFWKYLGEAGIFSSVIRVPVTFPAEPFSGVLLSGMCVPDLRGSQGTFSLFSSREGAGGKQEGGVLLPLVQDGESWRGELIGPENPFPENGGAELTLALSIRPDAARRRAELQIDGQRITLRQGEYSDWITVRFRAGLAVSAQGICRMYLKSLQPDLELYVTPVQIDPRRPALPISHPLAYSVYLGKLHGPFSTLGLAEDTWALNHGALDDPAFLEQCYLIHAEREQMFFDALEKTRRGACICVFDITDRVQHMFWRHMEPGHPAAPHPAAAGHEPPEAGVIETLYKRMDALVGRVLDRAGPDALVLVVSDHGFKSFRRGFNLNAWLHREGYLSLVSGSTVSEEWFRQVDWGRTRAYGMGLNGLYLNLGGRERHGIVQPGEEADALLTELRGKLRGITDPANGQVAVREVFDTREVYAGPYRENAPDLLVGYASGYRAAWESVNGSVMGEVFLDNTRPWSGDHCIDPHDVPGVLFANRPIAGDQHSIADVAPTILQLFGLPVPRHMDGKPWTVRMDAPSGPAATAPAPAPGI